MDRISLMSDMS